MNTVSSGQIRRRRSPAETPGFLLVGVLALAATVMLAACGGDDDAAGSEATALEVADMYFEAYNAGDAHAAISLFTTEASFSNSFYGAYPRENIEQDTV